VDAEYPEPDEEDLAYWREALADADEDDDE
jgi:hypothetical protein